MNFPYKTSIPVKPNFSDAGIRDSKTKDLNANEDMTSKRTSLHGSGSSTSLNLLNSSNSSSSTLKSNPVGLKPFRSSLTNSAKDHDDKNDDSGSGSGSSGSDDIKLGNTVLPAKNWILPPGKISTAATGPPVSSGLKPDFSSYKSLAIASNLLNINPTSTNHAKIGAPRILPNISPNNKYLIKHLERAEEMKKLSSGSKSSLLSNAPLELESILSNKVKENEKLRVIIEKLRKEIKALRVIQCSDAPAQPINDTIDPTKLTNSNDGVIQCLNALLDEKARRRKDQKPNKRQHLDEKNCISTSMLNLSIKNGFSEDEDWSHEEQSPSLSPSLSLTTSNTSDFNDIDIDSLLLINSLQSLSPATSHSASPNIKPESKEDLSHYLNNNVHHDADALTKLLSSNSIKLERSRSYTDTSMDTKIFKPHADETMTISNKKPHKKTNLSLENVDEFLDYDPVTDKPASNVTDSADVESLKLERSLSVPIYTNQKKPRQLKKPTKHIKRNISTVKPRPSFESCGFCVDGAPCLCAEAQAEVLASQKPKIKVEIEDEIMSWMNDGSNEDNDDFMI